MRTFSVLALALLGIGCSKEVHINTLRPAAITFPSSVQTLVIVDRTEFDKKAVNILEGILTGELPGEDKAGVDEAIQSLQSVIMNSPRFKVKRHATRLKGNSITGAFPDQLPWNVVEDICRQNSADAIVALEMFDTDFITTNGSRKVKKKITEDGVQKEVEVTEYYAEGVANVKIGFRLYDPVEKSIIDQELYSKSNTWQATGKSIQDAVAHLIQKTEATRGVSRMAGSGYASKITPTPITLTRVYYSRPKSNIALASGARLTEVGKWNEAIETYKRGLSNTGKAKTAGKICFNTAVAYEVMGDFDQAKEWAGKAYVTYGNKRGREYGYLLNSRIENENILNRQLNK